MHFCSFKWRSRCKQITKNQSDILEYQKFEFEKYFEVPDKKKNKNKQKKKKRKKKPKENSISLPKIYFKLVNQYLTTKKRRHSLMFQQKKRSRLTFRFKKATVFIGERFHVPSGSCRY